MRALLPLLAALAAFGCASRGWRTGWLPVAPCAPEGAEPGTLLVTVVDAGGLPLSGAIVEARARRSEPVSVGVADATGSARLRVSPVGPTYELQASLPGFYATCIEEVREIPGCAVLLQLPIRKARR